MSIPQVGLHFKIQKHQKLNLLKFRAIENYAMQIVDKYMSYQQIFFVLEDKALNVGQYIYGFSSS